MLGGTRRVGAERLYNTFLNSNILNAYFCLKESFVSNNVTFYFKKYLCGVKKHNSG